MKIVGTIVNKNMTLIGLLIKGKPSEFDLSIKKDYIMNPFKLSEVKSLIKEGKIKDYKINAKGNIEGINKKLSNLPMYDNKGNFLDKRMEIRSIVENNSELVGAIVYFPLIDKEKKLKIDDLSLLYEYFEPINFGLRERDNKYYITGKGDTKKEDIPVIEKSNSTDTCSNSKNKGISKKIKCSPGYLPFVITDENRDIIEYSGVEYGNGDEELKIPKRFIYKGKKYEVVGIGSHAFDGWEKLRYKYGDKLISMEIPDSVTYIGSYAFYGCNGLTGIMIPNSVTSIGKYAFGSCNFLTSIDIPDSVTYIGDCAFGHCFDLYSITIPDSVTYIGVEAFTSTGLTEIIIPNSVSHIGRGAFSYCDYLSSVTLPHTIKSIEDGLFFESESLTSVKIADGVTSIKSGAFFNCNFLTSIDIPNSVTYIGELAFDICRNLKDIKIPDNVTYIGGGAFIDCDSLTSIVIPDKVSFIGTVAFNDCDNLTSIVLPKSLVSLGDAKFYEDYGEDYGRGIFDGSPLKYIYYKGSKAEWDKIEKISDWSYGLPEDCEIVYNYEG